MNDQTGLVNWEEILDRELASAGYAGHEHAATSRGSPAAGTSSPRGRGQTLSLEQLRQRVFEAVRQGKALNVDICDEHGTVLLPMGSRISKAFIHALRERGITRVRLREPVGVDTSAQDLADELHTPRSQLLDERLAGELQRTVVYRPVRAWRRPRLPVQELKAEARAGLEKHRATADAVADLCSSLAPGRRISSDELAQSVGRFVDMAAVDFDLLPMIVALQESGDEYLYDHCVNVALLSMAMASQLGIGRDDITAIGLAGLLQDIGMLRVPPAIRLSRDPLGASEWHEIRKHPLHTLDMIADLRGLPPVVNFIVYQVHERMDGSGYPRGSAGNQLHEYAKLMSLADVYSAMIRPRPYRPSIMPYQAAKTLLLDGAADKFDRTLVRALLDTVSLFPIGSKVGLSDGSFAQVLRANPGLHTRPVVEALSRDGTPTGEIIDLSEEGAPHVVSASA